MGNVTLRAARVELTILVLASAALLSSCPLPPDHPGGGGDNGGGGEKTPPAIIISYMPDSYTPQAIDPGSAADVGTVLVSAERELAFMVKNDGFQPLCITGTPCVAFSGANASLFSLVQEPATTISAHDSTTFAVRITPGALGGISAVVSIENNDPDHGVFTFTISATVSPPPAAVPATGQTTSYATGDDGDLEVGAAWPATRFSDNGDGTTTDHLTGLMWASTAGSMTTDWEGALYAANTATFAGHEDWRLPNVNELMSLVNVQQAAPSAWLNGLAEFSGIQSGRYWTSTVIYEPTTLWGWVVRMDTGVLSRTNVSVIPTSYSWMVRDAGSATAAIPRTGKSGLYRDGDDGDLKAGVAWPSPRFVKNGEGVVLDLLTGLIWHQSPSQSVMNWEQAFAYAQGLDTGGYHDWRVPNRAELRSLSSYDSYYWQAYLSGYFDVSIPTGSYWSSSTYAAATDNAWVVLIESGHSPYAAKGETCRVWAVRGAR